MKFKPARCFLVFKTDPFKASIPKAGLKHAKMLMAKQNGRVTQAKSRQSDREPQRTHHESRDKQYESMQHEWSVTTQRQGTLVENASTWRSF